jgi:two-component system chemotaxis response regulator CheY
MKVLIVDDSALARGLIRRTIKEFAPPHVSAAMVFVEAMNGEEALERLREGGVGLVLVDWNMPVLDGIAFVREVRAMNLELPIVMITAVSDEEKIHEACLAGVSEYVEKPFQGPELWSRIKGYVK